MDKALSQPDPGSGAASGQLTRVLVVEDDQTMRHLVVNYLEEHNIQAISASRRDEVARLLAVGEPSLVILDLRLGETDGLDLLREIRSRSNPLALPTVRRKGLSW